MKGLNGILSGAIQEAEDDSWKEENEKGWSAILTYEHGGAYYCFRMEKLERSERDPHGITEATLQEIADALPKKLKPLPDGLERRFRVVAHQIETRAQRKL